jgi:non-ribosomal peptide synthetase component F
MATTERAAHPRQLPDPQSIPRPAGQERTLLDVFAETVGLHPDATALEAPDALFSYEQLTEQVGQLALELREAGIGPGERVGIRMFARSWTGTSG